MTLYKTLVIVCCIALLSGCARDIRSNVYTEANIGEASFTYQGVISSSRKVKVKQSEKLGNHVGGAILGSTASIVNHRNSIYGYDSAGAVTALGGIVLAGIAGAYAEKHLNTQDAMEYVVKLANGQLITIVQGLDNILNVGQQVLVLISQDGRSRVIPDNSGIQSGI